ncbi:MAG: hypothetical protein H7328_08465 [Bdellovibrio sp.]|nr:hypothetical protein [Bdellovibrio sp.]
MRLLICVILSIFIMSCSNKPCKIEDRTEMVMTGNEKPDSSNKDLTKRVFVFKPDGSLQCGMGTKIDPNAMKKEFSGGIEVFSAENKNDGLMRIQLCGHPTGQNNVFEIADKDLEPALKLGFKKWIRD